MARKYFAKVTSFKTISGQTTMPKKPTTVSLENTNASTLVTDITAALSGVSSIGSGESIQVIITSKEV